MKSKEKGSGGDKRSRGAHKPKTVSVAEGSLQSRAPGAVMRGGPDSPFPTVNTGSQQSDRGRAGATTNGWSARQRGERMQAQAEQNRQGESRQSESAGTGSRADKKQTGS